MGVIHHQQLARLQGCARLLQPGTQAGMQFAAPASGTLGPRNGKAERLQLGGQLGGEGLSAIEL